MKIKRFFAKDMRTAIAEVKEALGADAVIMSNKKVSGGVEIVAAIDSEPSKQERFLADDKVSLSQSTPTKPVFANLLNKYQLNISDEQQENEENQLNAFLAKNSPHDFSKKPKVQQKPAKPLNH